MNLEKFLAEAQQVKEFKVKIDPTIADSLRTLAGWRRKSTNFRRNVKRVGLTRNVTRMVEFGENFVNLSFDEAVDVIDIKDGASVQVIVSDLEFLQSGKWELRENPKERTIRGRLVGLLGYSQDDSLPSFRGIAEVRMRNHKDYVAVLVSNMGTVWLNPAHLDPSNAGKSGKEIILQLFPPPKRRRKRN